MSSPDSHDLPSCCSAVVEGPVAALHAPRACSARLAQSLNRDRLFSYCLGQPIPFPLAWGFSVWRCGDTERIPFAYSPLHEDAQRPPEGPGVGVGVGGLCRLPLPFAFAVCLCRLPLPFASAVCRCRMLHVVWRTGILACQCRLSMPSAVCRCRPFSKRTLRVLPGGGSGGPLPFGPGPGASAPPS